MKAFEIRERLQEIINMIPDRDENCDLHLALISLQDDVFDDLEAEYLANELVGELGAIGNG